MVQAKDLYFKNKCNTCHGDNAEKSVAGSRVLKDMSPEDIKAALVGYLLMVVLLLMLHKWLFMLEI